MGLDVDSVGLGKMNSKGMCSALSVASQTSLAAELTFWVNCGAVSYFPELWNLNRSLSLGSQPPAVAAVLRLCRSPSLKHCGSRCRIQQHKVNSACRTRVLGRVCEKVELMTEVHQKLFLILIVLELSQYPSCAWTFMFFGTRINLPFNSVFS